MTPNEKTFREEKPLPVVSQKDILEKNGLEEEIDKYKINAINKIKYSLIVKPSIFSFVALILSFFLDLAYVPLLGNITVQIAQSLFPNWQPTTETISPYSFWWLPIVVYSLFILLSYLAFNKLKAEVARSPVSETIDRIIASYNSVVDSISTALPLIGAAVLLISIKLGEEVFLGISVPFEIKALIVLALGKLFEPVFDQLGIEFQNVITHVTDIRDKYFSRIQIENSRNLVKQISSSNSSLRPEISVKDMEAYRLVIESTYKLSDALLKNFSSIHTLMTEINKLDIVNADKIERLNTLANSISAASISLKDERTIAGLKHLEAIVKK